MLRSATFVFFAVTLHAADWPMWRHDPGRTAATTQKMPAEPHLLWSRELPPLRPAFKEQRLQFDRSYEPVVAGKRLLVGSSREDCIIAFDTDSGEELWRALADGPVRFAPVIVGETAIFGSDDGIVRCVKLADGSTVWQKRAVPSNRLLLGNQRLISVWPVRGGPVAKEGRVYFAAGVWPLEGTFVFCCDAATGTEIWRNDRCSYLYGTHPHATEAMGGLAPQGYLLIDGEDLIVPCSTAYPARLDLKTGAIKEFELPSAGRLTGGWFASTPAEKEAAKLRRRGLLFDEAISAKRHEDKPRAEGQKGIQRTLNAADKEVPFDTFTNAHSVILADDKCFVVTTDGVLSAYGPGSGETKRWKREIILQKADEDLAKAAIAAAGTNRGYALMIGPNKPGLIEAILLNSQYHLVVLAEDYDAGFRLRKAGLYGERVVVVGSHDRAALLLCQHHF
ncbi:MAG: PQQ-like beta-propeller repeat protein [Verrucomicrobiaceae bacterium]|nr:PQQ-like beta-propeller repeat protein [Verrucomicrobiaceae bacterium]